MPGGHFQYWNVPSLELPEFWLDRCEVTNRQYARFDPKHESRYEHRGSWIFSEEYLGYRLDGPEQPVVRVSWERAMDCCRWLSGRSGLAISLESSISMPA